MRLVVGWYLLITYYLLLITYYLLLATNEANLPQPLDLILYD